MLSDFIQKRGSYFAVTVLVFICRSFQLIAQQNTDTLLQQATLQNVIGYALKNQPAIQQSYIDEKITDLQVKSKLADWYPQINFSYLFQHNFRVPSSIIGGNLVKFGVTNTSAIQFSATQTIFNRDVLLANRTKGNVLLQMRQQTENIKIDVVVNVTKAFYDVLATEQQIKVGKENIVRLERSLHDAKSRYDAGIVDKTDYKRATIALNNSRALRKSNQEALTAKIEYLKLLMNYPGSAILDILYDSAVLENEIAFDTLRIPDYTQRIEYQILETNRKLVEANLQYNKWSFIPTLSANGAYNFNYQNNDFGKLYNTSFPNSYGGLTLAFPIFQGGKRKYEIQQANWELKRIDLDLINLKNSINADFIEAMANYKASLANYFSLKENVLLAGEVYDVIQLQYSSGIKTYLEVITAETDLRTAQINYFNSLYSVLSSKIDVQRTVGEINP